MSDFDREIERELGRVLGRLGTSPVPAWKAPVSRALAGKVIGGTGAALSAKLAAGFAVAALAATGATEASITGSFDPSVWGQQVKQQVSDCKGALAPGQHGIGACVSDFAQQNSKAASQRSPSPSQVRTSAAPATGANHTRDGSTGVNHTRDGSTRDGSSRDGSTRDGSTRDGGRGGVTTTPWPGDRTPWRR